jgi:acyl-coenzyme A synthetase/AMP-(fatty) acid ligase
LLNGASLHFFDPRVDGLGTLADWLEREDITMYRSATSVFRSFASQLASRDRFPRLRVSVVTAEPVHARDVELFRRHFADSGLLCNELGLTEAGTVRSFLLSKDTPLVDGRVPVGYPVEDVGVLLLDPDGRPVAPGAIGEIVVRSRFLADGYWRRPDLTAARFRVDPEGEPGRLFFSGDLGTMAPDGCLVHHGRRDFQAKVRGHRVEIEDVEAALVALPGVHTAAVVAREDALGGSQLTGYVVLAGEPALAVADLRSALAASVPAHMIPATFVRLDAMPLTTGGKVDRRALPPPPSTRPELAVPLVAPRTPLEALLAEIWAEVLELGTIGVLDDFLDLGGDSLRAGQIVGRVRAAVDVPITEATLLEAPTVEAMALRIQLALLDAAT